MKTKDELTLKEINDNFFFNIDELYYAEAQIYEMIESHDLQGLIKYLINNGNI